MHQNDFMLFCENFVKMIYREPCYEKENKLLLLLLLSHFMFPK